MEFTALSCQEFADVLASKAPVPGGGGASALVGALGAALGNMVGALTVGKKKYAGVEDDVKALMAKGDSLRRDLLLLAEKDAEAFEPLSRAYGMPKDTPEQAAQKEAVMEEALKAASMVPLTIMEKCAEALTMIEGFSRLGSRLALSDAGVAACFAKAALQGASLNVFINTKAMKDRSFAEEVNNKARKLLETYEPLADEVAGNVKRYLLNE